jgi:hypothetical protein
LLLGARRWDVAARVVPPEESEPLGAHSRCCPFDKGGSLRRRSPPAVRGDPTPDEAPQAGTPRRRFPRCAAHGPGAPHHIAGAHAAVMWPRRDCPAAPNRYRKHRKNGPNQASVHSLIGVSLCKHYIYTSTRPRKQSQLALP